MSFFRSEDANSGALAEFFVTIDGNRYKVLMGKKFEANFNKTKTKIGVLGKSGKVNKTTGWDGTFTCSLFYATSIFRELLYRYKETGKETYFDIQVTNEDKSSETGRQTFVYKNCTLDGGILSKFDIDSEVLEEDISGTFEDFEMPEKFKILKGME